MLRFEASEKDERFAIWEHARLLERVAGKGKLLSSERPAVRLCESDPKPRSNFHELCFGSLRLLREQGDYAFHEICRECDLGGYDFWGGQQEWVRSMFRAFFSRDDGVGWFSILTARRPADLRGMEDPTLKFETEPKAISQRLRRFANIEKRPLEICEFHIPMRGLRWASHPNAVKQDARLTQVIVPRKVSSSRFSIKRQYYEEHWYTLSQPTGDDESLRSGRIPALGSEAYRKELYSVRTTIFLSFIHVSLRSSPWQSALGVEIHPVTGEVLSMRWDRSPLSVALLNDAPVELQAISEILRKGAR